jgi:hypothetical protein
MGRKFIDFTGRKFGKLLVISLESNSKTKSRWKCLCDCGEVCYSSGGNMYRKSKNSGCRKCRIHKGGIPAKNLIGQRFGKLTVLEVSGKIDGRLQWKCQCACGNVCYVHGGHLGTRSGTKSCGCNRKLPFGESGFNSLYGIYKRQAEKRNKSWNIPKDDFRKLTKLPCHYCGTPPSQSCGSSRGNGKYVYNGLDRVDNNLGYELENVVPCCGYCNYMKMKIPVYEFKCWISKVYNYWIKST